MTDRFTKKRKKTHKKLKRAVGIIMALLIVILLVILVLTVTKQVGILQKEVNKIRSIKVLESSVDTKIYATGAYAEIEETMKTYMNEYVEKTKEVSTILDDDTYTNLLCADNIQKDGPGFYNSKTYILEKEKLAEADFTRLMELIEPESVQNAVEQANLGIFYTDLCEHYLDSLQQKFMHTREEFETAWQQVQEKLEQKEKVIDFLKTNSASWSYKDGVLTFETEELTKAYNTLVGVDAQDSENADGQGVQQ